MRNTLLNKKIELTVSELETINEEIDFINERTEVLDSSNPFEANELEALEYRLTYIEQLLETSIYWTQRGRLTLVKGGGQ